MVESRCSTKYLSSSSRGIFSRKDDFVRSFHFDGYAVLEIYPLVVETDFLPVRGIVEGKHALLPVTTSNCCL